MWIDEVYLVQIPAAHLSGDLDTAQTNSVYSSLYQRQPGTKLLYVTPEKVSECRGK
jgi:bloom syndrome protein